jgi:integrase/recombinase XerC
MKDGLTMYRRHTPRCPHRQVGREWLNCRCPLWCSGTVGGRSVRESLGTRNVEKAGRLLAKKEAEPTAATRPKLKSIAEAVSAFHQEHTDLADGTRRNHRRTLKALLEYSAAAGLRNLPEIAVEHVDQFRGVRAVSALTWTRELATLRHFFSFCMDRDWVSRNPAKLARMPRGIKPTPKEPYSSADVVRILAAAEDMPDAYSRARAKALVLLLRNTALRIGDITTLRRDAVHGDGILVRTMKTGTPVLLPIPSDLLTSLGNLPEPRPSGAEASVASEPSPYFFWTGRGSKRAVVRDVTRTLAAVFRKSGVEGAHAHRFRHTLAAELLAAGAEMADVARILGNTVRIVEKHYAVWSPQRQDRIYGLLQRVFGTKRVHDGLPDQEPLRNERSGIGGRHGIRTHDPRVANAVLSQLS